MKGVLNFLEKAGLVRNDTQPTTQTAEDPRGRSEPAESWLPPIVRPDKTKGQSSASKAFESRPEPMGETIANESVKLEEIYAAEGVPASVYPAERLLRLVDGLSAMDDATRNLAISAMDAADESWTIADPLADARAKVSALQAHSQLLRADLQQLEADTHMRLQAASAKQEEAVSTIRKQILDMEALLARETARGEQENAAQQSQLQALRDQTARKLAAIDVASQRLQSLNAEFSTLALPAQD